MRNVNTAKPALNGMGQHYDEVPLIHSLLRPGPLGFGTNYRKHRLLVPWGPVGLYDFRIGETRTVPTCNRPVKLHLCLQVIDKIGIFKSSVTRRIPGTLFLRNLVERRSLLFQLVRRDFEQRYVGSAVGWIWGLIQPLVLLLSWSLVFGFFLQAEGPRRA